MTSSDDPSPPLIKREREKKREEKKHSPVHVHRVLRVSRAVSEQRRRRGRHAGPRAELGEAGAREELLLEREVAREHGVQDHAHGPHVGLGPVVPVTALLPENLRQREKEKTRPSSMYDSSTPVPCWK